MTSDTIAMPAVGDQSPATEGLQHCDECAAPVDREQRYCVACGAHRRHVVDPAARYFSNASARTRSSKAAATARTAARRGRSRGLGVALAIAIVPVAAAVGVVAGRSSNNQDASLIRALARHQAATGATTTVAAAGTAAPGTSAAKSSSTTGRRHHHAASTSSTGLSTKNAGKVLSTTSNGSAQQITGFKPTQSEEQQGSAETKQVQKSTGKNYVNGQNNLPSQVVVP